MMTYSQAGQFNGTGAKVSVPAGTSSVAGKATLVSRVIPNGARMILDKFSAKVIDIGNADQVFFAILRNG